MLVAALVGEQSCSQNNNFIKHLQFLLNAGQGTSLRSLRELRLARPAPLYRSEAAEAALRSLRRSRARHATISRPLSRKTHVLIPATRFRPGDAISLSLSEERAQGKPGADCARIAVCNG